MLSTPFFPVFRSQLAALGKRTSSSLRQLDFLPLCEKFRDLIPVHLLASEDEGPGSRDRIFSLRLTLEGFIWQLLKPHTACREVVRAVQALFQAQGWGKVDEDSSAYVQARHRLSADRLKLTLEVTAQTADHRVGSQGLINGRPVKAADGSTLQLADTPQNQECYAQAPGQKPGCGFPLMKFLPIFSLSSGAISHVETSDWKTHDVRLLQQAWGALQKGDVLLVDRAFGDYVTLASLPQRGVDVVARLHGARKVDFRKPLKRLAPRDALFQFHKAYQPSNILTAKEWGQVPDKITVRIVRFTALIRGRKVRVTLVTTLLDPVLYPAAELVALYRRRWQMELTLRHLKTTMKMEQLRCQSPAMARKELLVYLLAYNLIRCLMAEAVAQAGVEMERVSFRGTMDALRNYASEMRAARSKRNRERLWEELVAVIAADLVPNRPGRTEPRAVKHRPKAYPLLNKPRRKFKEVPHRYRQRKNKTARKSRA